MSRKKEYKDVVQKLVGRQTNASRGSPDQQRRLQQRQMLQQLRQHVSEARFETGEAMSHIQEEMYKMEARLSQSGSLDSEEGIIPAPGNHAGTSSHNPEPAGAAAAAASSPEKYQSDTLRAMRELILKQRQSVQEDYDPDGESEPMKVDGHSAHLVKDNRMT